MMETIRFRYVWLSFPDKNNHIYRISVAVKKIHHHFCMSGELIESNELHLIRVPKRPFVLLQQNTKFYSCTQMAIRF